MNNTLIGLNQYFIYYKTLENWENLPTKTSVGLGGD